MKSRPLSRVLMYLCLFAVLAAAWWSYQRSASPGPLHSSHAGVALLAGDDGCAACHEGTDFAAGSSMAVACNECHEPIRRQLADHTGIHGALASELASDCAECHHEHIGDTLPLVSFTAFHRAGIGAPELYDHAHTGGIQLTGRHIELECAGCHINARNSALVEGQPRFLGLSEECATCHNDVHKGELGPKCADCHGQEKPFKDAALYAHPKTFPLVDGHAHLQCKECHTTPQEYTGLRLDCASCHQDEYDRSTKPSHAVAKLGTDCASCHGVLAWNITTYTHNKRFALEGAHASVQCAQCHSAGAAQQSVEAHAENPSCVVCHRSPHDEKLVQAAHRVRGTLRDDCAVCHEPAAKAWSDANARMTPILHASTGFVLTAPHDKQTCAECHPAARVDPSPATHDATRWAVAFPGRTQDSCEACHKDPHRGQFVDSTTGNDCLACHARAAFLPTTFDTALHARCAFPLDGSHKAVACAACHPVVDGVRKFVGVKSACIDCHDDVHKGSFDRNTALTTVNGKIGCARCHTTESFARVNWSASDHALWTSEPLTGKHATAACNDCHRREKPIGRAPAPYSAAPKACAACHEDVHLGQFRIALAVGAAVDRAAAQTDCARCHTSTESFKLVTFDHQRDSRFALDDDHRTLACAACHKPTEVDGRAVIRYKPLGVTCAECHDARALKPRPLKEVSP